MALTLAALWLLYGNLAALNAQFAANFAGVPALPVVDLFVDSFYLFGMFDQYEVDARELIVEGRLANTGVWMRLDAGEMFPGNVADRQIWAQGSRSIGELLPAEVVAAERARLLARIRRRHNKLHPDHKIERARVGHLSWPKSARGHDAQRLRGRERFVPWYAEP